MENIPFAKALLYFNLSFLLISFDDNYETNYDLSIVTETLEKSLFHIEQAA